MYLGHASAAAGVTRELLERELTSPARARGGRTGGAAEFVAPEPPNREQRGRPMPSPDVTRVRRGDRRRVGGERTLAAERDLTRVLLHRPAYLEQVIERVGAESFRDPDLGR